MHFENFVWNRYLFKLLCIKMIITFDKGQWVKVYCVTLSAMMSPTFILLCSDKKLPVYGNMEAPLVVQGNSGEDISSYGQCFMAALRVFGNCGFFWALTKYKKWKQN